MKYLVPIILALSLLLVACQTAEQPEPAPAPVVPEVVPEDAMMDDEKMMEDDEKMMDDEVEAAEGNIKETDSGTDKIFGAKPGNEVLLASDVKCSVKDRKLTFRFTNVEKKTTWQINNEVPLIPPEGLVGVQVLFNNRVLSSGRPQFENGERLFGPEEKFSDNCGGVEKLEPGKSVTCTLFPVPLRSGEMSGTNDLFVNPPGTYLDARVRFNCN